MNVIVIASLVVAGTVIIGALLAILFRGFNRLVVTEQHAAETERQGYNAALTYGFKIPVDADAGAQMKAARKEAARRAAALPRGANVGIAQADGSEVQTAYKGVHNDPISAVKIASVHSWEGLRGGSAFSPAQTLTHADAVTAPPTKSAKDLVPGKDFAVIEITEEMTPAEKRKARIANAKAKSAAAKALKTSGGSVSAASAVATPATEQAATAQAATAVVTAPVAGVDYEVIEITEDMAPDQVRTARIANVKAKSAAMKAYKASGGAAAPPQAAQLEPAATPEPVAEAAPAAVSSDIAPPDLIEIVDGMAPEDVRSARIHNAKAQAAYKKALKAAGIDPSSV